MGRARLVVDMDGAALKYALTKKPYLIKPNEYEIEDYIGVKLYEESETRLAAENLRSFGIENVMITLGGRGAALASAEGSFFVKAPHVEAVSTIGAGDSSIAGFIYAMSRGYEGEKMLKCAIAFGTASCLEEGTKPPKKENVLKILQNGSLGVK